MSINQTTKVSVILPVYNGQKYLKDSIDSILAQTYTDFELVIVNDGSTDDSEAIIQGFDDPRIRYYKQSNHGISATLNLAIRQAKGRYIARQDSDDLSHPDRLIKQVAFLDAHPKCGVVGTWAEILVEDVPTDRVLNHPINNNDIKFALLFDSPFVHSSVMMRKELVDRVSGYPSDLNQQSPEDFELWSLLSPICEFANIPEFLLKYREIKGSMSRIRLDSFFEKVILISTENIAHELGISATNLKVRYLAKLAHEPAKTESDITLSDLTAMLQTLSKKTSCGQELFLKMKSRVQNNYPKHGVRAHVQIFTRFTTSAKQHILSAIQSTRRR